MAKIDKPIKAEIEIAKPNLKLAIDKTEIRETNSGKSQINQFCLQHPEEINTYFCFTCLCPPICPECIIHGVHRDHDVKTLKKSYPLVKEQILEMIQRLELV